MNQFPVRYRRTKVVIAGTALAAFVQPGFPAKTVNVSPHLRAAQAGKILTARTALPTSTTLVTAPPVFVDTVQAAKLPKRAGLVTFRRTPLVNGTLGLPSFDVVRPTPRRQPTAGRVVCLSPQAAATHPAASQVTRPDIVRPTLGPRRAAPQPVTARTWPSDPMARPAPPRISRAPITGGRALRLAALCQITHSRVVTNAIQPSQSAVDIVHPATPRPRAGQVVARHAPFVDGTLALPSIDLVKPTPTPRLPGRSIVRRAQPAQLVLPTPSIAVKARARAPVAGHAVCSSRPTPIPASPPRTVVPARAPSRATPRPAVTHTGLQVAPLPTPGRAIRAAQLPRRPGRCFELSAPAIVWPTPTPHLVAAARPTRIRIRSSSTATPPSIIKPLPQPLVIAPVKRPRVAGVVRATVTPLPSVAQHGPVPVVTIVTPGRPTRRTSPAPIAVVMPSPASDLPVDLFDAVLQRLRKWPGLAAAFGDTPTTLQFWSDVAGRGTGPPYLTYDEVGDTATYETTQGQGVPELDDGMFQLAITAKGKTLARQLRLLVEQALDDPEHMTFVGGEVIYLRHGKRYGQAIDDSGSGTNAALARLVVEFTYKVESTLAGD